MVQDRWRNRVETSSNVFVFRSDPCIDPDEGAGLEFRLTYEGQLLSARDDAPVYRRSAHIHQIRKRFHLQLRELWQSHPILVDLWNSYSRKRAPKLPGPRGDGELQEIRDSIESYLKPLHSILEHDGFSWMPLVPMGSGMVCKLEILMLRSGPPGKTVHDVDNRLKTLFDALRLAKNPNELGAKLGDQFVPEDGEMPFFVLLEDDSLITHVSVTSDTLLEPVLGVPYDQAVRLVIGVTVTPYHVQFNNLEFT